MQIDAQTNAHASGLVVYLDGKLLENCFFADEEAGIAKCYVRDAENNYIWAISDHLDLFTVTLHGKVIIRSGTLLTAPKELPNAAS